jgi:hypothetical protein
MISPGYGAKAADVMSEASLHGDAVLAQGADPSIRARRERGAIVAD